MKRLTVFWIAWAGSLIACPAYRPGPYHPRRSAVSGEEVSTVPRDIPGLIQEADAMVALGPSGPDLNRSLACADAVLAVQPHHEGAAWRAARALFFLSFQAVPEERAALSARCMDVAKLATSQGKHAESFYYAALCMGSRARARNLEGLELLPEMVEAGQAARRINPRIMQGGPDRLLGGIYLRAPAWPTSVGDLDEALAHLTTAIELAPDWPENHLLFAEALIADDRGDEAREVFMRAEVLMKRAEVRGWLPFWETDVRKLKKQLGCPCASP